MKKAQTLPPRTGTILKSIVDQYIIQAMPVPSQSIVDDYELAVSSATIRNEMAYLEKEGYIRRPHPSAGSIPSDKGYRYYVDSLSDVTLPLAEQRLISHLFHQVEEEMEKWLSLAAGLIARLVQNVAVVTMAKAADSVFKHLEIVSLKESLAQMILVLREARVKQQLISFDQAIPQSQLTAIAHRLSEAYQGLNATRIQTKEIELSPAEQLITDSLLKIMRAEDEQEYDELYLDGWHFLLNQPEFVQSRHELGLLEMVEQRNLLKTIIPYRLPEQGISVIIGQENKAEPVHNYSVVINKYGLPDEAIGTITVIGPTRMPYARTIAAIDYISSVLSRLEAKLYGKE